MAVYTTPTTAPTEREFEIKRRLDAPRILVYKAWTDPRRLEKWWGPKGFATPVCEIDARPGGVFRIVMRSPDGVEYPITGRYEEVWEPSHLSYTNDLTGHPAEWHAPGFSPGMERG